MIFVVTPYCTEDISIIRRAHDSVMAQDTNCIHVLVADGHPYEEISRWKCQHIVLPIAHRDGGSFARGVGASHAVHVGADYVAFLDADNWIERYHLSSLVTLAQKKGISVATSRRTLRRIDGSLLDALEPDSDGVRFADTSTIMLHKEAYDIIDLMQRMPREMGAICDQIIWLAINERGYHPMCTQLPTMHYRTRYGSHYLQRGEVPPSSSINGDLIERSKDFWNDLDDAFRMRLIRGYRA